MPARRNRWLAGALGLLAPGLGHLYLGRASRFVVCALAAVAIIAILAMTGAIPTFAGFVVYVATLLALPLFSIVDALLARGIEGFVPKWYNRWYVYVGWFVLVVAAWSLLVGARSSVLGYGIMRMPSPTMAPTIEPGELVLVDTRAYRERLPDGGDVVIVWSPRSRTYYVKRALVVSPGGLSFENDNPRMRMPLDNLNAPDELIMHGRVTHVLYSPDTSRIGRQIR